MLNRPSIRRLMAFHALLFLFAGVEFPSYGSTDTNESSARLDQLLTTNWHFAYGAQPEIVIGAQFNDAQWTTISLPHTWNHFGEYRTTRTSATNNQQGVGFYRLQFEAPKDSVGKKTYLQFDAVGNVADVWVNGTHVGTHKGAFSRFRIDVSSVLKPEGLNLLVVKADNSKPAPGSTTENVIPLSGDFFIHGGLYRMVHLIQVAPVHIDLEDYGGPGVYISTPKVSEHAATAHVNVRVRNTLNQSRSGRVLIQLLDAHGKSVGSQSLAVNLKPQAVTEANADIQINNPIRWQSRKNPYLYSARVSVSEGGKTQDQVLQSFGVREFKFDPNLGLVLNGQVTPLHGVSRHQDRLGKGWALTEQDHLEDMSLIAEMGANTVRLAHYQHAQEWVDLADKFGMVAWAEIPYVNQTSFTGSEPKQELVDNARQQLVELIRQNFNHPSILMWSVGNEVDLTANMVGFKGPGKSLSLLRNLNAYAHQLDASRPTTFADCCEERKDREDRDPASVEHLAGTTDLIGYNRYFGWYYDTPKALGAKLDYYHKKYPNLPISVSEYGAGGALNQFSDDPTGGVVNSKGRPHPAEYETWVHEQSWPQLAARPYIFANWIWNMFDFSSDIREEGEAIDINDKGMVSFDRKTRKDVFYYYKSQWSNEPMIHLNSARYVDRSYAFNDIRAYSSEPTAELTINGKTIGKAACPQHVCVWPNVLLDTGANHVEVSTTVKGQILRDSANWNAPDVNAGLAISAGNIGGLTTKDGIRFGSDHFFNGGEAKRLNTQALKIERSHVVKSVTGVGDPQLFQTYREGNFSYDLPVPNGKWGVRVYTFEPDEAMAASRTFSIEINNLKQVDHFKPAEAAHGVLVMTQWQGHAVVTDGHLRVAFAQQNGPAIVAGLQVIPE